MLIQSQWFVNYLDLIAKMRQIYEYVSDVIQLKESSLLNSKRNHQQQQQQRRYLQITSQIQG